MASIFLEVTLCVYIYIYTYDCDLIKVTLIPGRVTLYHVNWISRFFPRMGDPHSTTGFNTLMSDDFGSPPKS